MVLEGRDSDVRRRRWCGNGGDMVWDGGGEVVWEGRGDSLERGARRRCQYQCGKEEGN